MHDSSPDADRRALIAAARGGDADARSTLAALVEPLLDRYLEARTGPGLRRHLSTSDLRQDVLAGLDELLGHLREGARWRDLEALVVQRARWNLHKAARRPRPLVAPSAAGFPGDAGTPAPRPTEGPVTRADRLDAMHEHVERLDSDQRKVVRGRLGGQTFAEIAADLSIPESTVRYRFVVGINALRREMGEPPAP